MKPASYENINRLINSLLLKIRGVLGEKLLGFYLYGSLVWGDFDSEISDIDLLAVLSDEVDEKEFIKLENMHRDFVKEYSDWDDRIEVQYFSEKGLKNFRTEPGNMAVISPGDPLHMIKSGKDWLMNWYFVQEYGVALFGPAPGAFIPPIAKDEFISAVKEQVLWWKGHLKCTISSRPYQAYAILTMCRSLYTLKNEEQVSKKKAAMWTEKEIPQYAGLIENALKWREDFRNNAVDPEATFPATAEFVNYMIGLICPTGGMPAH